MRISTKIIIVTLTIFTGALIFYDLGLRAEYLKSDFADPHRQYAALNFTGFDEVELRSSTSLNIKIVQGPYQVLADPEGLSFVKIKRLHNRLIISAAFSDFYHSLHSDFTLLISCPKLTLFKADAVCLIAGRTATDTTANNFDYYPTLISGFNGRKLTISADHAANLVLENNQLDSLIATVGTHPKSRSNLTICKKNVFIYSDVQILHNSYLRINDYKLISLHYQLADSAMLLINGAAVKHISKSY